MELNIEKLMSLIDELENGMPVSDFKEQVLSYHPYEISEAVSELDDEVRLRFYSFLSAEELAPIWEHFDESLVLEDIRKQKIRFGTRILENMALDDAARVLQEMEIHERTKFLNLISPDISNVLKEILQYDSEAVGSIMLPSFLKISPDQMIKEASKVLVQDAVTVDFINYLYVIEDEKLVGVLSLKELITSERRQLVKEVMNTKLVTLNVNDSKEQAIKLMSDYDFTAIPVIEDDGKMVGIVTHDDIIDIIDETTNEDFAFFGAVSDGEISLENERLGKTIRSRLPWLFILLLIGLITSSIMSGFEATISVVPLLVMFLPVISDMAGNVGTQSLATAISMISSEQLNEAPDRRSHVFRELGVGLLNSIVLSILCFGLVLVFSGLMKGDFNPEILKTSFVISLSLGITLNISNLAGALIPLIISRFKIDPATASGPLITTINDIFSVTIYFTLATLLLKG